MPLDVAWDFFNLTFLQLGHAPGSFGGAYTGVSLCILEFMSAWSRAAASRELTPPWAQDILSPMGLVSQVLPAAMWDTQALGHR